MMQFAQPPNPVVIAGQSAVAQSHTGDTVETALATVAIPAGAMGANGCIHIPFHIDLTGTGAKTIRFKLGATVLGSTAPTTQTFMDGYADISNRGAANSQYASGPFLMSGATLGVLSGTGAVDSTIAQTLTITCQLATTTDTVTLQRFQALLYPKG